MRKKAIFATELAREDWRRDWLKSMKIHPDPKYLMPDPIETLKAAEALVRATLCRLALHPCRSDYVQTP